jgi:hypothetical protein
LSKPNKTANYGTGMTLQISNHTHNLNILAKLSNNPKKISRDDILTQDALACIKEANDLKIGYLFHPKKYLEAFVTASAVYAAPVALIALPILLNTLSSSCLENQEDSAVCSFANLALDSASLVKNTAFSVMPESESLNETVKYLGAGFVGYSCSQDGREMLKFAAKTAFATLVYGGWKAGARVIEKRDTEAANRNASIANKNQYALKSLCPTYKGMTEKLNQTQSGTISNQARSILTLMPAIQKLHESMGLSPEESRDMTSGFRGALEMHAMRA